MTGKGPNSCYSIYDKCPAEEGHSAKHINFNSDTGKGSIVEHDGDGNTTTTDISCYLTTACMKTLQENFDDNCYELTVLRWFRDNFVSEEDIEHYYITAPIIVDNINKDGDSSLIYDYIYENIVKYCVRQIECGNYAEAYEKYKNGVLMLEERFLKPVLINKFTKALKLKVNNLNKAFC